MAGITPSQTVGPFFEYCLTPEKYSLHPVFSNDLTAGVIEGERISIEGQVLDGDGVPVTDALVEIWQPDGDGVFAGTTGSHGRVNIAFKGFGRAMTNAHGSFSFTTIKPGRVPGPAGALQAPHLGVTVFCRGILTHLFTRIYFADEDTNASDPVLALVPADRRETLIAASIPDGSGHYRFDIRLQEGANGEPETVFFEA